ncbi:hypothetical protein WN51_05024 [Melipona quadrifasciata]|uniref:Uncharacterized protein n=1 Tax=Melipona quadrifasciata TaxID=166423 RepID=A0A0M8ZUF5_9HYME|nr:hypothetical protein WN51_05024 [Melipona quadrifasciata]
MGTAISGTPLCLIEAFDVNVSGAKSEGISVTLLNLSTSLSYFFKGAERFYEKKVARYRGACDFLKVSPAFSNSQFNELSQEPIQQMVLTNQGHSTIRVETTSADSIPKTRFLGAPVETLIGCFNILINNVGYIELIKKKRLGVEEEGVLHMHVPSGESLTAIKVCLDIGPYERNGEDLHYYYDLTNIINVIKSREWTPLVATGTTTGVKFCRTVTTQESHQQVARRRGATRWSSRPP